MVTLLDKVLYLYPNLQQVVYWHEKNSAAPFDDPYDRLIWNNATIPKPALATLNAVTDAQVLQKRAEDIAKDEKKELSKSLLFKAIYAKELAANPTLTVDKFISDAKAVVISTAVVG